MIKKLPYLTITASFLFFLFMNIPTPVKIQGDGVFYYSWAHSIIFDLDVDFKNQLQYFAKYDFYSRKFVSESLYTPTGMIPNPYAFGTAVLWMPFILLAHLIGLLANYIFNKEVFPANGFSAIYFFAINFASWFFGTVSLMLNFKMLKQYFSEKASLFSIILFWLGTPWVYYQFFEPSMSHMASLVCVSALAYLGVKKIKGEDYHLWLIFLSIFFATIVRWQNALFGLLFLFIFSYTKDKWRLITKENLSIALALFSAGLLQIIAWKVLYGSFFIIPQGNKFIFSGFYGLATLFSSNRGLLYWSPIFLLSFLGMFFWGRNRRILFLAAGAFLSQWLTNSSLADPGGGDAFGARRFIETIPFLVLFFAGAITYFQKKTMIILAGALAIWSLLLLAGYHYDVIPRSGEFSLREIFLSRF